MSPFHADSIPQRNPRVAARVVEGQALVVVLDERQVYRLDAVGSRIWELCEDRSVADICAAVAEEFDVEPGQALQDALTFFAELRRVGAVL